MMVLRSVTTNAQGSRLELCLHHERTHDGRAFRLLTLLDEYTRECLAIEVQRQMNHQDLDRLAACSWIGECLNTFGPITGRSLRLRRFGTG